MSGRLGVAVALFVLTAGTLSTKARHGQAVAAPEPLAWQASAGPLTGIARLFAETEAGTLFALVSERLYRSRDDGASWVRCESQPAAPGSAPWMFTVGRRLYAISKPGVAFYASDDECASSYHLQAPALPAGGGGGEIVTSVGGVLLASYIGPGLFRSADDGRTWTKVEILGGYTAQLAADGPIAYRLASGRLYHSADQGTTWTTVPSGPLSGVVTGGRHLFGAGGQHGLQRRDADSATWSSVLPAPFTAPTARHSHVHVAVRDGISRSVDDGATWRLLPHPAGPRYGPFAVYETRSGALLAGTGVGIFRWTSADARWSLTGAPPTDLRALAANRGGAYAVVASTFWRSADSALTWSRVEPTLVGLPRDPRWPGVGLRLLAATDGVLAASAGRQLVTSTDGGSTWSPAGLDHEVYGLEHVGGTWYAATWQGLFRSSDFVDWHECSSGILGPAVNAVRPTTSGDLIALASGELYRSTDGCRSWWPLPRPPRGQGALSTRLVSDERLGILLFGDGIAQLNLLERRWTTRVASHRITDVVRDASGRYWVASGLGVSSLDADGPEWRLRPAGLDGPASALAVDSTGLLIAAIDGRGIFRARLSPH